MEYVRTVAELETRAILWWPPFLSSQESNASIIPTLLKTQDEFISLLKLSGKTPFTIFEVWEAAGLSGNLLLKHLAVLCDVGGEMFMRINQQFTSLFSKDTATDKYYFCFVWKEQEYRYDFRVLPLRAVLKNARLGIDAKHLLDEVPLSPLQQDVVALLLFGSTCTDPKVAETLIKCEVGALLGLNKEIDKFVDQRYIWVSRITGGAQANTLGQNAQSYVVAILKEKLGSGFTVESNGTIDVGSARLPFDVVVTKAGISVGVEVSFQVTTNSTIERKANEAVNRFNLMHEAGHRIAYIIDGAGNFQRRSALAKICSHSDCTVAYTNEELDVLVSFIREVLH